MYTDVLWWFAHKNNKISDFIFFGQNSPSDSVHPTVIIKRWKCLQDSSLKETDMLFAFMRCLIYPLIRKYCIWTIINVEFDKVKTSLPLFIFLLFYRIHPTDVMFLILFKDLEYLVKNIVTNNIEVTGVFMIFEGCINIRNQPINFAQRYNYRSSVRQILLIQNNAITVIRG